MNGDSAWHFITAGFGSINYRRRASALAKEVANLEFFETSEAYDEKTFKKLSPGFFEDHKKLFKPWIHGHGYYLWKPALIRERLRSLKFGSFLAYLDAGFVVQETPNSEEILRLILEHTEENGITVFTSPCFIESDWCSTDLMEKLKLSKKARKSPQKLGGAVFIKKTSLTEDIVETWYRLAQEDEGNFLHPKAYRFPNSSSFVHHAHDQAILSCLVKSRATESAIFAEEPVQVQNQFTELPVYGTGPFNPARHRFAYPYKAKLSLVVCFWNLVSIVSRIKLAIFRRLYSSSV